MPKQTPRHLAQDRQVSDTNDLLEAGVLGPVIYQADTTSKKVATVEDNPMIAEDDEVALDISEALSEFQKLVMVDENNGRLDRNLELQTIMARDEIMRLYSATNYDHHDSFAPFGRPIKKVTAIQKTGPIWLHCKNENYSVQLPCGFEFEF